MRKRISNVMKSVIKKVLGMIKRTLMMAVFYIHKSHLGMRTDEVFVQQNCVGNLFNRMDIVVRYLAIECYFKKNDFGFDLYRKMQAERIGNGYEVVAEKKFKDLIASYEENGYDRSSEIVLDCNLMLMDGSHRLALALYYGIETVSCKIKLSASSIRYDITWFVEHGFSMDEIQIISKKSKELLEKCNGEIVCVLWPPVEKYYDEITEKLSFLYKVVSVKDYTYSDETFKRVVKGIYSSDDIADWKIEKKIDGMKCYGKTIRIIGLEVKQPRFRLKMPNGHTLSVEGENIKRIIRNAYKGAVTDYFHDIIIHTGDNYEQSQSILSLLEEHFLLRDYFELISSYPYVVIKLESEYWTNDFPNRYPFGTDVGIVCKKGFEKALVADTIEFVTKNIDVRRYTVRHIAENSGDIIRIECGDCLVFQFDIVTELAGISQEFIYDLIANRENRRGCYVPSLSDELVYQEQEYRNCPKKKQHLEFIQNHKFMRGEIIPDCLRWMWVLWLHNFNKNASKNVYVWIEKAVRIKGKNQLFVYHNDLQKIVDIQMSENVFIAGGKLETCLNELIKVCDTLELDREKVLIVGSSVLEYYGIRESNDMDIVISHELRRKFKKGAQMFSRNVELVSENYLMIRGVTFVGDDELINNPQYHIVYKGIKIAKLPVVWIKKYFSGREKDAHDLTIIHEKYME